VNASRGAPPGWIVANLDAEAQLAGSTPPRSALETAAAFGTLLRVYARPGDRLLLPAAVDGHRLAQVPGLERPELVVDAPTRPLPGPLLAWCETRRVAQLRLRDRQAPRPSPTDHDTPDPWHLPHATPRTTAAVHHRRFHLRLARHLGETLPGACWITSRDELEHHLGTVEDALGTGGSWVLKAPFSAAGRDRLYGGGRTLDTDLERRVDAFLRRFGGGLFEPWLDRLLDFGLTGFLTSEGPRYLALHRLLVQPRGAFLGIEIHPSGSAGLAEPHRHEALRRGGRIARALARTGFRGPFGIDGLLFRAADAAPRLRVLGEINARFTFGHIARALVERLDPYPGTPVRLRLGTGDGPAPFPLLHADGPRSSTAWLEPGDPLEPGKSSASAESAG
jgi:hypothetical protein